MTAPFAHAAWLFAHSRAAAMTGSPMPAVVAWGDVDALVQRVQDHLDAGASHVCIQALNTEDPARPGSELLEALAPRMCGE